MNNNKIVFLTQSCPYPLNAGAKIRNNSLIQALSKFTEVNVICLDESRAIPDKLHNKNVKFTFIQKKQEHISKRIFYPFRPYVINGYSKEIEQALKSHYKQGAVLWVALLDMAQYINAAKEIGYKVILDEHNVESDLFLKNSMSKPQYWPHIIIALMCRFFEKKFCRQADLIIATSTKDASRLHEFAKSTPIKTIPNTICVDDYKNNDNSEEYILFTGTLSYLPNIESIHWFISKVFPILTNAQGTPNVVIAGSNPPPELVALIQSSGIRLIENPDNMIQIIRNASIVIVPLISGSGTRLKILEALASNKAVVSTRKGAEGLELENNREIIIAENAHLFANAIIDLLNNKEKRQKIAANGLKKVSSLYHWKSYQTKLQKIVNNI